MDPVGRGPEAFGNNRMSIAYLAPARRDPSPEHPRQPAKSTPTLAEARGDSAARMTGSPDGPASIPPPSFKQTRPAETRQGYGAGESKISILALSLGDEDESEQGDALKSASRDPRPSYTEEQKFFIMWARITQEKSWPEIEKKFSEIWNLRTKGGLTSVYYRIRKSWKLKEVLCLDGKSSEADRQAVTDRARHFSGEFLRIIGYGNEMVN